MAYNNCTYPCCFRNHLANHYCDRYDLFFAWASCLCCRDFTFTTDNLLANKEATQFGGIYGYCNYNVAVFSNCEFDGNVMLFCPRSNRSVWGVNLVALNYSFSSVLVISLL